MPFDDLHPSAPDGDEEHLFVPLGDADPGLAARLRRRYAERWLLEAELPADRLEDAMETLELKVAPDDRPGHRRLRLRSFYTGTIYWLYEWDGSEASALELVERSAELQGWNAKHDRRHGPRPWDEPPTMRR